MCLKCAFRFAPSSSTSSNFGGITIGSVYYVLAIPSSTTFSISTTLGGSQMTLTAGMYTDFVFFCAECVSGSGSMSLRLGQVAITSCTTSAFSAAVTQLDSSTFFKARCTWFSSHKTPQLTPSSFHSDWSCHSILRCNWQRFRRHHRRHHILYQRHIRNSHKHINHFQWCSSCAHSLQQCRQYARPILS